LIPTSTVADEIKARLTPEQQDALANRIPVDPAAHLEYLQGLYFANKDTELDLRTAIGHFEKAVARSPAYAAAHAELAMTYFWLGHAEINGPSVKETGLPANAAVAKALQLDPSLARAHLALGLLMTNEWNWPEAERQYRLALSLNPNCAECHHQYGVLLQAFGRNEEAVKQIEYAIELDPLDDANRLQLAAIAFTSRQYDLAISRFEALHTGSWPAFAWSYAQKEMYVEAIEKAKICESNSANAQCLAKLAYVYAVAGKKREAQATLARITEITHHHYVYPTRFAIAYLGVDKDQALTWLERAYDEKDPALFWLKVAPIYDPLRSEPRFQALMRKLNFSP
jgi:serine/threonine-protein kinase